MPHRKSKSFSLSYGVVYDSLMSSNRIAMYVYKISRNRLKSCFILKITGVISIWHKAYILAIRLVSHHKSVVLCNFSDLRLAVLSNRHECPGELLLGEIVESICLILLYSPGLLESISSIWKLYDPCIVSRSNIIAPDGHASRKQRLPFYISVACNTWIRSSSAFVFVHKIVYYVLLEFFLEIHNVIRNIELRCHTPGIIHSRKSAASGMGTHHVPVLILPYLHGNSYYIVALLLEQKCGNRRVDSA